MSNPAVDPVVVPVQAIDQEVILAVARGIVPAAVRAEDDLEAFVEAAVQEGLAVQAVPEEVKL